MFAVVPAHRRPANSADEIHLYCEEPGVWHRLPQPRGVYPITQPAEWFRKLGPYLQNLTRLLKHAAPLTRPVLSMAVDELDEQRKSDSDLMTELTNQLSINLPHGEGQLEEIPVSTSQTDFRVLEAMLTRVDPNRTWGGLSRTTTPEGLTVYLCEHHVAQYRHPG